jgi:potassium-dependent mechanosensitive channel
MRIIFSPRSQAAGFFSAHCAALPRSRVHRVFALMVLALFAFANLGGLPGLGSGMSAMGQAANAPLPAASPVPVASPVLVTPSTQDPQLKAKLDASRLQLDQIDTSLKRDSLTDNDLLRLRGLLAPLLEDVADMMATAAPRVDVARGRLEQLGAAPDAKAAPESAEIAADRAQRDKALQEADDTLKIARALSLHAGQLVTDIADRRRSLLAAALFMRGDSLLDPNLWVSVVRTAPSDISAIKTIMVDWLISLPGRLADPRIIGLVLALLAAAGLSFARRRLLPSFAARDPALAIPNPWRIALAATTRAVLGALPVAVGCYLVMEAAASAGLVPMRLAPVLRITLGGIAFVAFSRAMADALLAPELPQWRLVRLDNDSAQRLHRLIWRGSALIASAKVVEALLQAIAAALPLSVAVRGVFALAFALLIANALRKMGQAQTTNDAECLGPFVPVESRFAAPLRLVGWICVLVVIAATLLGYVTLSGFTIDQIIWVSMLGAILTLALALGEEGIAAALAEGTRLSLTLQSNVGLRRRSIEQIGIIAAGTLKVTLIVFFLLMALAPWGVQSGDMWTSLKAAFFGFKVGDVTVSLSSILIAAFAFGIGLLVTRAFQRWLDTRYLPTTELDSGLRNSINTGFGYIGITAAAAIAIGQLGVSLDKLTIVAGALSVGIGFGLQSIVSNFVSGLILLWERPIRVGDLVVIGESEGYVRRISVRATEVQAFDRSMVLIPNANLISGVVRNRVRGERTGRILISLTLPRSSDPAVVRKTLLQCAQDNHDVMKDPLPKVFFKKIGESTIDFDLICLIPDVESVSRVTSDLNFAIHTALSKKGMSSDGPELAIRGLDRIEDTLEHIAEAIESEHEQTEAAKGVAKARQSSKRAGSALVTTERSARRRGPLS